MGVTRVWRSSRLVLFSPLDRLDYHYQISRFVCRIVVLLGVGRLDGSLLADRESA